MTASKTRKLRFPVLNAYFLVIRRNIPMLMLYITVFLGIMVLNVMLIKNPVTSNFEDTKSPVAFFDYDNTPFSNGLRDSLAKNADFVNIKDNKESLQDALFYRSVVYIIKIPKGFTAQFLSGETPSLERTSVQKSTDTVYIDSLVNRYLNVAGLYEKNESGITDTSLAALVKDSVSETTPVTLKSYNGQQNNNIISNLFGALFYSLVLIIFLGVSSISLVFNRKELLDRCAASPLKPYSVNLQLLAGNFIYTLIVWLLSVILALVIGGKSVMNQYFTLYSANMLCVSLSLLGLSFFIGNLIGSRNAQHIVGNTVALGMSFLSGVFVPQKLLGSSVIAIARFTPAYWYIKNTLSIGALSNMNSENLNPILISMLIQLGFAVMFFAIAMALSKYKKASDDIE